MESSSFVEDSKSDRVQKKKKDSKKTSKVLFVDFEHPHAVCKYVVCFFQEPLPSQDPLFQYDAQDGDASADLEALSFLEEIKTDRVKKKKKESGKTSMVVLFLFIIKMLYKSIFQYQEPLTSKDPSSPIVAQDGVAFTELGAPTFVEDSKTDKVKRKKIEKKKVSKVFLIGSEHLYVIHKYVHYSGTVFS